MFSSADDLISGVSICTPGTNSLGHTAELFTPCDVTTKKRCSRAPKSWRTFIFHDRRNWHIREVLSLKFITIEFLAENGYYSCAFCLQ